MYCWVRVNLFDVLLEERRAVTIKNTTGREFICFKNNISIRFNEYFGQ